MQDIKDLVSVIIPTHNRVDDLKNAVASVLEQSYQNMELIIIANGCQDHTATLIKQIKKNDPRQCIVYLEFEQILGAAKARNIGIDRARGEYIAFLDDDDSWHHDKLQTQIEILDSLQYSIVGTNYIYTYGVPNKHIKFARSSCKPIIKIQDMYYENLLGSFSFCTTRKKYLDKNCINEKLDALQDWDLWLKILLATGLPAYVNQDHHTYYRYHLDGKAISRNFPLVIHAQKIFLDTWSACLDTPNIIHYHQMRTACFELKIQKQGKSKDYICQLGRICKAIFASPSRYSIKRYMQYILFPIFDIRAIQIWLLQKFIQQP